MKSTPLAYFHSTKAVEEVSDRMGGKVTHTPEKKELPIKKVVIETDKYFFEGGAVGQLFIILVDKVDASTADRETRYSH